MGRAAPASRGLDPSALALRGTGSELCLNAADPVDVVRSGIDEVG